jgi:hypothetical protein
MQEIKGTASGNWEDQTHEAEVIAHGAWSKVRVEEMDRIITLG